MVVIVTCTSKDESLDGDEKVDGVVVITCCTKVGLPNCFQYLADGFACHSIDTRERNHILSHGEGVHYQIREVS